VVLTSVSKETAKISFCVGRSDEAFEMHKRGPSKQQANRDWEGLKVSASGVRFDIVE
jgi:hypothetical protein